VAAYQHVRAAMADAGGCSTVGLGASAACEEQILIATSIYMVGFVLFGQHLPSSYRSPMVIASQANS